MSPRALREVREGTDAVGAARARDYDDDPRGGGEAHVLGGGGGTGGGGAHALGGGSGGGGGGALALGGGIL